MHPPVYIPWGASAYDFGPRHPLRPERYEATRRLLARVWPEAQALDAPPADEAHAALVHSREYLVTVRELSSRKGARTHGFESPDNPPFLGMWEASLAYLGGTVAGVQAVLDGEPLAFNWTGGLHHAARDRASGFCVLNDAAVACALLRHRFARVAYIDIDLHHGDGVQSIFYDDPAVLTYSVHESGVTLFPGTGSLEETGPVGTSLNLPLPAGTGGDVWLDSIERTLLPSLERFAPQAVVLQAGCDAHRDDPLGHLEASVQDYVAAVLAVRRLGLPTVVLGGGGYAAHNVPRMWTAATLALAGRDPFPPLDEPVGPVRAMADDLDGWSRGGRAGEAEGVVERYLREVLPLVPSP